MKVKYSIRLIYMMRTAMIYAGFPMWWIADNGGIEFGAVINDVLIPQSSWRKIAFDYPSV